MTTESASDIDLAIHGGNTVAFAASAGEDISTLLMLDVVDLDKSVQAELLDELKKDGVASYKSMRIAVRHWPIHSWCGT